MLTGFASDRTVTEMGYISIRDEGPYSARNSSKGALIEEAARLFGAISSGLSIEEVREQVFEAPC